MMKRSPGRPIKKDVDKRIARNISLDQETDDYILKILDERNWSISGNYSKIIKEIIRDHKKVVRYKEIEMAKHKEKLELLS